MLSRCGVGEPGGEGVGGDEVVEDGGVWGGDVGEDVVGGGGVSVEPVDPGVEGCGVGFLGGVGDVFKVGGEVEEGGKSGCVGCVWGGSGDGVCHVAEVGFGVGGGGQGLGCEGVDGLDGLGGVGGGGEGVG